MLCRTGAKPLDRTLVGRRDLERVPPGDGLETGLRPARRAWVSLDNRHCKRGPKNPSSKKRKKAKLATRKKKG
ncbi:hypothetical protein NDU88_002440 [Pleurodeles waltl]|uniref:Uncharacterized protein n=1 Tax=Pleurodeles waltl TaxID=8319 RepID=A0AAV7M3C5_PLEWA|nr:hypothetical protein NDU88_002440 [Pleurodeles waltl]